MHRCRFTIEFEVQGTMMHRVQYTRIGYELLSKKLAQLKGKDRREIALDIEISRVQGDIRESIDYADAKERQGMLEARIRALEDQLRSVEIIDRSMIHDRTMSFQLTAGVNKTF